MTVATVAPSTVVTKGLTLRPVSTSYDEFILDLFASTREAELTHLPLTDAQKRQLIEQQCRLQDAQYRATTPAASFDIVELNGTPIGRFYVDRSDDTMHIVDISLCPQARSRGIGTWLITDLLDEAGASSRSVQLHVVATNPARRLYERLGFVRAGSDDFMVCYEWTHSNDAPEKAIDQ